MVVSKARLARVVVLVLVMLAGWCLFQSRSVSAVERSFPSLPEVEAELLRLNQTYGDQAALFQLGTTWENNTLWAMRIFDAVEVNESSGWYQQRDEPDLLFLAAIHGDEPQGVNLTLELARDLLEGHGNDLETSLLVAHRRIWIIPVANPDGYARTHRKNGRDGDGDGVRETLEGVDLNRNFGYRWGTDGHTSSEPTSRFYHGPGAFSEPESRALRDLSEAVNFSLVVSYHSGVSNPVFYTPWGYADVPLTYPDNVTYARMGENLSRLTAYGHGPATDPDLGGYTARGDLVDWLYANLSTFAWTVELPERMSANDTVNNLAAARWLLARPWDQETKGPLEDLVAPGGSLPDVWIDRITFGSVQQNTTTLSLGPGQTLDLLISTRYSRYYLWPADNVSLQITVEDVTNKQVVLNRTLRLPFEKGLSGLAMTQMTWGAFGSGHYAFHFVLDYDQQVAEHNETNNRYTLNYEVIVPEPLSSAKEADLPPLVYLLAILLLGGLGSMGITYYLGRHLKR